MVFTNGGILSSPSRQVLRKLPIWENERVQSIFGRPDAE